jgi:hypothetical protein
LALQLLPSQEKFSSREVANLLAKLISSVKKYEVTAHQTTGEERLTKINGDL